MPSTSKVPVGPTGITGDDPRVAEFEEQVRQLHNRNDTSGSLRPSPARVLEAIEAGETLDAEWLLNNLDR